MRIVCIGYRDWAIAIYKQLMTNSEHEYLLIEAATTFDQKSVYNYNPDLVLLYGWSWIVRDELIDDFHCLMLHPAPLPKYRGGSPIQNQIINDESESAVTIFLMDKGIDTGPIFAQEKFSLIGDLDEVFERIITLGVKLTQRIIDGGLSTVEQDDSNATYCRRRKPSESEITIEELLTKPASYLHNKIRMLQDPYPNAYITAADGCKLFITKSKLEE